MALQHQQPQEDKSNNNDKTGKEDPRYTLTENERTAVIALKDVCDEKGLVYGSIFELAKYVLVSYSTAKDTNARAEKIRLDAAVKRITQRQKWRQKYGIALDGTGGMEALQNLQDMIQPNHQNYFVMEYETDRQEGMQVVGLHCAHSPNEYVFANHDNLSNYLQAEAYRLELAAADLEEARRGVVIVSIFGEGARVSTVIRFFRLLSKLQETLQGMHPHRIRCLCVQVPKILYYLSAPAKALMPKKIGQRLIMVKSLDDVQRIYQEGRTSKPSLTVLEWAKERQAKYDETIQKVTL